MCPKLIELLSWNGPTVHVCCFILERSSTKTFVSRVQKTAKKNLLQPKNSLAGSLLSRGITVLYIARLPSLDRSNGCNTSIFQTLLIAQAPLGLREYQLLTRHPVQVFEFGTSKTTENIGYKKFRSCISYRGRLRESLLIITESKDCLFLYTS